MFEHIQIPLNLIPSDPRFGSGPSLIPMSYLQNLLETKEHLLGTSHRKDNVKNLVGEVVTGFKKYFSLPADYTVVFGNGGATHLFDMIGLGLVEKSSAHFTCGEFSEKWYLAHKNIPWITAQNISTPVGKKIEVTDIPDVDMICMTLNETSTGLQLTTEKAPQCKNPETLICVDATSGAGQIPWDISSCDVFFFSPQKVFASEGGLWVAFMSPKAVKRSQKILADKSRYIPKVMDFSLAIDNSTKNQTYNTPSVINFYLLNEQLKEMNKLGLEKVVEMSKKKAELVYGWAQSKPYLSPFVEDAASRSIAVSTIDVDAKYPVDDIVKLLQKNKIAYDIDGYRKLGRNQLRISLFHNITYANLEKLTQVISFLVENN